MQGSTPSGESLTRKSWDLLLPALRKATKLKLSRAYAPLAQLAENVLRKRMVVGSIPTGGLIVHARHSVKRWTHKGLNPGPPACSAGVIPLHHVPSENHDDTNGLESFGSNIEELKDSPSESNGETSKATNPKP